ncbi:class I SAM-dependent methyltransferase [Rhodopseudomonas palustris]|uniref:class I SAM-dependent methyltransferase n=1 Tax=Rhodopseudomonas palustris TaxID=1076 RepID=UPI00115CCD26|nr:class I SAM-dependent methyltransferase [Rhodopseudomonas palustris]QDL99423.1 class I SAM-dependent methyltransferase [Rhodopseudomonas palustris]
MTDHWQNVYATKGEQDVSWFQDTPTISLDLIAALSLPPEAAILDVGGGASRLVDHLLDLGRRDLTVLDLSEAALATTRDRLGPRAAAIRWIVADVTRWTPERSYAVWHDRAAFHFLTAEADRAAYRDRLLRAVAPDGYAVVGTFAFDGPERCSGLPVARYDADGLQSQFAPEFEMTDSRRDIHATPWGAEQRFQFATFRRRN